jgi:DNA-binding transcriptional ArsR family regulator
MQLSEPEFDRMLTFLKVLADRSRLRILGLLAEREYTVKELADVLSLREPTVSSHLTMLKLQGVVEMRPQGTSHFYRLKQDGIHALLKQLTPKGYGESEAREDSTEFERSVLNHFFQVEEPKKVWEQYCEEQGIPYPKTQPGMLKQIPMQHKKLWVVLNHLVKEFDYGVQYTEPQVNETLKRFYTDYVTLRRMLIDNRLMARERGVYWRISEPSAGKG